MFVSSTGNILLKWINYNYATIKKFINGFEKEEMRSSLTRKKTLYWNYWYTDSDIQFNE
jgi:hypothetical protein